MSVPASITVMAPAAGHVWELGATYNVTFTAAGSYDTVVAQLQDRAGTFRGRWVSLGQTNVVGAEKGPVECAIEIKVPVDIAPSEWYCLKLESAPKKLCEAEVVGLHVAPPLEVARVGEAEVQVRWSAAVLPRTVIQGRWRLSIKVRTELAPAENAEQVLGDIFLVAAHSGQIVHCLHLERSILIAVTPQEAAARRKFLRLAPNRAYDLAITGVPDDGGASWTSSFVDFRLGSIVLDMTAGGFYTLPSAARNLRLADADFVPGGLAAPSLHDNPTDLPVIVVAAAGEEHSYDSYLPTMPTLDMPSIPSMEGMPSISMDSLTLPSLFDDNSVEESAATASGPPAQPPRQAEAPPTPGPPLLRDDQVHVRVRIVPRAIPAIRMIREYYTDAVEVEQDLEVSVRVLSLDDIRREHHSAERAVASFRFGAYDHPDSSSALGAPLALDPNRRTAFGRGAVGPSAAQMLESRGRWEVDGNNKEWSMKRGLSVVALRCSDLSIAFQGTFDSYSRYRVPAAGAAVGELRDVFLSEQGALHAAGAIRSEPVDFLILILSSGGWEAAPATDLGRVLREILESLGLAAEECERVYAAAHFSNSNKSGGRPLAVVAYTHRLTQAVAWMHMPEEKKKESARLRVSLSFDGSRWFPTFARFGADGERWVPCLTPNMRLPLLRRRILLEELEGLRRRRNTVEAGAVLAERVAAAAAFMCARDWRPLFAAPPNATTATGDNTAAPPPPPSPDSNSTEEEAATAELEVFLRTFMRGGWDAMTEAVHAGVVEYLTARTVGMLAADGTPSSLAAEAEATAGGAVDTTQQVVRALQLLCGMATARGHHLLPELTRRGLLEAAVRGALYLHQPEVVEGSTAGTADDIRSVRAPKRRRPSSSEARSVARALDRVMLRLVELNLATVRLTMHLPGASASGEVVMGLATQLVSWGPATAEGAARLVELNLATDKMPAQSALLGLDADDVSLRGAVLLLRAKGGLWATHAALVALAPTLVWLAAEAGAAAVVFVWPGGLVQPLLPHPNHDVASPIPSVVLPDTHPTVTALLLAARKAHNANPAQQSGTPAPSPVRTPAPPASPPSPTIDVSAAAAATDNPASRVRLEPAGATAAAVIARRCGALLRWRAVGGVWPFAAACNSAAPAAAAASASARALRLTARGLGTVGGVAVRYSGTALGVAGLAARASGAAVTTAAGVATSLVGAAADSMGAPMIGTTARTLGSAVGVVGSTAADATGLALGTAAAVGSSAVSFAAYASGSRANTAAAAAGLPPTPPPSYASLYVAPPSDPVGREAAMDLLVALGLPPQSVEAPQADGGASVPATAEAAAAQTPVRILALDGGGVRGIAAIAMLEEICRCCGGAEVADMFDLIAGTSTGGIIAMACALGYKGEQLGELYRQSASEAFASDTYTGMIVHGPGAKAARSLEAVLRRRLTDGVADMPMNKMSAHVGTPRVCLVSNMASREPSCTFLFRNYVHPPADTERDDEGDDEGGEGGRAGGSPGVGRADPLAAAAGSDVHHTTARVAVGSGASWGTMHGEHSATVLDSIRATSAAPWYFEELVLSKDLTTGVIKRGQTTGADTPPPPSTASPEDGDAPVAGTGATKNAEHATTVAAEGGVAAAIPAVVRFVDGGIAANNPADAAVHEARRLYGADRPLVVVSVGTGSALPRPSDNSYRGYPSWIANIFNATGNVSHVDATVRHLLGRRDAYFRFNPTAEVFGCALGDTQQATLDSLAATAKRYMDRQRMAELLVPSTAERAVSGQLADGAGGEAAAAVQRQVGPVWTLPPCWCLRTPQQQGLCVRRAKRYHGHTQADVGTAQRAAAGAETSAEVAVEAKELQRSTAEAAERWAGKLDVDEGGGSIEMDTLMALMGSSPPA